MNSTASLYEVVNNTYSGYSKDSTIQDLIMQQCIRTPERTAAVCAKGSLTYGQLEARASQLACLLIKNGAVANKPIGIMMSRSLDMLVAIYAILKSGAPYLTLSVSLPSKQLKKIISNCSVDTIISDSEFASAISPLPVKNVFMQDIAFDDNVIAPHAQQLCKPEDIAYILHTSGSTGIPKGVAIRHFSLVNRLEWFIRKYEINENDVVLQKTVYTFDVSIWEYIAPLLIGGSVCLLEDGKECFPSAIIDMIHKYGVTVMHFVPSILSLFLQYCQNIDIAKYMSTLRWVFCSGDALLPSHVKSFSELINKAVGTKLTNFYGPTEAAIDVLYYDCSCDEFEDVIPIGMPIQNVRIYVLTGDSLAQIGEEGELCIAGDGLALGYVNEPDKTNEVFCPAHFIGEEVVYHTGDRAVLRKDGNFIYLGRMDRQVKIYGIRIELGEIESAFCGLPEVTGCAALANIDNDDNSITVFLTAVSRSSREDMYERLRDTLPHHCFPNYIVYVNSLPKMENGKTDYVQLRNLKPNFFIQEMNA